MQGVFTKFLQLWIPNKTDKGSVVTDVFEPNFTKLDQNAEATNRTLTNLSNNKLNKGTYSGNATTLKTDIDNKVSKSGDTMTGVLTISNSKYPEVVFNNAELAAVGYSVDGKSAYLRATKGTGLKIYEDNTATLQANNLNTKNKEVVAAINELNEQDKGVLGGYNGIFPLTVASKNGIYLLPATNKFYVCVENYSGSSLTAPNANFEELSVYTNRNKLENLFSFEEKKKYVAIANFNYLNCEIYKLGKMCLCNIRYEYQGVLPKTRIPFPITFVRPPIVTMVDNDTEMGSAYNNIAIGWPTTSDVEVKGTIQGATLILIGQFIS